MKKIYIHSLLLLGIGLVLLGIWSLLNPALSLRTILFTIAIMLIFVGLNYIISYFQNKTWPLSRWVLFDGIVSLLFGILIVLFPNVAEQFMVILFALWLFVTSIFHIFIAFALKRFKGWWLLLIFGILTGILALLSFVTNAVAAISAAVTLSFFFLFQGFVWISLWRVVRKLV